MSAREEGARRAEQRCIYPQSGSDTKYTSNSWCLDLGGRKREDHVDLRTTCEYLPDLLGRFRDGDDRKISGLAVQLDDICLILREEGSTNMTGKTDNFRGGERNRHGVAVLAILRANCSSWSFEQTVDVSKTVRYEKLGDRSPVIFMTFEAKVAKIALEVSILERDREEQGPLRVSFWSCSLLLLP